jgi:hypothetical protein
MPARALTAIVVIMGILIVAGLAALAMTIAGRSFSANPHRSAIAASRPLAAPPIDLPKGAHVTAIGTGTDRAVVAVALPDGGEELLIIDLSTGRTLATVPLRPTP